MSLLERALANTTQIHILVSFMNPTTLGYLVQIFEQFLRNQVETKNQTLWNISVAFKDSPVEILIATSRDSNSFTYTFSVGTNNTKCSREDLISKLATALTTKTIENNWEPLNPPLETPISTRDGLDEFISVIDDEALSHSPKLYVIFQIPGHIVQILVDATQSSYTVKRDNFPAIVYMFREDALNAISEWLPS